MKSAALVLLGISLGCGSNGGAGTAPVEPQPPIAIAADDTVVARAGEQMTFAVTIHNLAVAEIVYTIGGPAPYDGKDVYVVETRATSSRLLTWLHPVDDTLTSWIDVTTGRPVAYKAVELASSESGDYEVTEVRFAKDGFAVHGERKGNITDEHQVVQGEPFDTSAFLTFVRSWDAEPGAQVSVDLMRSRGAWRTKVIVAGYDHRSTALGELPMVRYDAETVRLLRDGTPDPTSDTRKFSIWITDDADRVPAHMVARTDWGDIQVDLVAYRAQ